MPRLGLRPNWSRHDWIWNDEVESLGAPARGTGGGVATLLAFALTLFVVKRSRSDFEDSVRADVDQAIASLEAERMGLDRAH